MQYTCRMQVSLAPPHVAPPGYWFPPSPPPLRQAPIRLCHHERLALFLLMASLPPRCGSLFTLRVFCWMDACLGGSSELVWPGSFFGMPMSVHRISYKLMVCCC
ncbi:hypothetical protein N658DRAFT_276653 [Parathielavia hyrcaniae]|uniref:Uncharacterized protein n=1 Tax=Parathielavia hyrcaniae TaxID=113614 RepID=A0AAN6Q4N3_9PEZI|nr:hypothetical protein N658DRAFT_276653 [Parathielavia hyrcaniae]